MKIVFSIWFSNHAYFPLLPCLSMAAAAAPGIGDFYQKGNDELIQGETAVNAGHHQVGFSHYAISCRYFAEALKKETNENLKAKLRERLNKIITYMEQLKPLCNKEPEPPVMMTTAAPVTAPREKGEESSSSKWFTKEKPNVKWDEIIGLEEAKQMVTETFEFPSRFPSMFKGKRTPWKGMLLYGPPGTGKTLLVKAMATGLDALFIELKSSSILSKFQGDSEKNIDELFKEARQAATKETPVIIFIDELEALCINRQMLGAGDSAQVSNMRMVTEFLQHLDGFSSSNDNMFVVGATNLPWNLDEGILRRFPKRLYIPLPTLENRINILKLCLIHNQHLLTEENFVDIANETNGFSGSDLQSLMSDALFGPVRDIMQANKFLVNPVTNKLLPIRNDAALADMQKIYGLQVQTRQVAWRDLQDSDIDHTTLPVTVSHVKTCLEGRRPVTSQSTLTQFEEWTKNID